MQHFRKIDHQCLQLLELASFRHYPLQIELLNGERFRGIAITVEQRGEAEWLLLETCTQQRCVRLDMLLAVTPDIEGAAFQRLLILPAC